MKLIVAPGTDTVLMIAQNGITGVADRPEVPHFPHPELVGTRTYTYLIYAY